MGTERSGEFSHKKRQDFLQSVVNYLDILRVFDEGVIITDREGRIMFFNEAIARIDGVHPESVIGMRATEFYDLTDETSLIMQCLHSKRAIVNRPMIYKTRYGRIANTICSVYPLLRGEGLAGSVCFVRDYNLLENTITSICSRSSAKVRPPRGNGTRFTFSEIAGNDPNFLGSVKIAKMAALTPSPVMLHGETGTGKELFAQSIHNYGPREKRQYVAINCAAIPETLLEGILFGTVKGAFTGAVDKLGLFEKANGGTLFLDEVNSMPIGLQAKLLRVVQEKKVRRVGSLEEREIDVKLVSSVNEDPHGAIERGRLRLDLFYRLGVVLIRIPPLRERREDIQVLTRLFVDKCNEALGRQVERVSEEVMELFFDYEWPGSVRELEHVVEGAMNVLGERNSIELSDLPGHLRQRRYLPTWNDKTSEIVLAAGVSDPEAEPRGPKRTAHGMTRHGKASVPSRDLIQMQSEQERHAIEEALTETRGNVSRAARILGISRQLLHYKMKKYGFDRGAFES